MIGEKRSIDIKILEIDITVIGLFHQGEDDVGLSDSFTIQKIECQDILGLIEAIEELDENFNSYTEEKVLEIIHEEDGYNDIDDE